VRAELEEEPHPSVSTFAEQLRAAPPTVALPAVAPELRSNGVAPAETPMSPPARRRWSGHVSAALAVFLLGATLAVSILRTRSENSGQSLAATRQPVPLPDTEAPAIAVLPFRSGTDQGDLDLASGLTDEITYDL